MNQTDDLRSLHNGDRLRLPNRREHELINLGYSPMCRPGVLSAHGKCPNCLRAVVTLSALIIGTSTSGAKKIQDFAASPTEARYAFITEQIPVKNASIKPNGRVLIGYSRSHFLIDCHSQRAIGGRPVSAGTDKRLGRQNNAGNMESIIWRVGPHSQLGIDAIHDSDGSPVIEEFESDDSPAVINQPFVTFTVDGIKESQSCFNKKVSPLYRWESISGSFCGIGGTPCGVRRYASNPPEFFARAPQRPGEQGHGESSKRSPSFWRTVTQPFHARDYDSFANGAIIVIGVFLIAITAASASARRN